MDIYVAFAMLIIVRSIAKVETTRLYQNSYQELFDGGGVVHCFRKNEVNVRRCSLLLESKLIELVSRRFRSLLDISFDDVRL